MAFKCGLEYNFLREWIFLISSDGAPCAKDSAADRRAGWFLCVCVCFGKTRDETSLSVDSHHTCPHVTAIMCALKLLMVRQRLVRGQHFFVFFFLCACKISFMFLLKLLCRFCMTLACLRLQTRSLHPKCKFDHLFIPELYDFFWCNTKDVLTNVHSAFSHIYWKYKVTVKL